VLGCGGGQGDEGGAAALGTGNGVELRDGRVWLDVSGSGQLVALEQLAEAGDFELELHGLRPRGLTLRLEGVPLAEAVAALVGDANFAFDYKFDAEKARHEIAVLHVGPSDLPNAFAARWRGGGNREEGVGSAATRPASDSGADASAETDQIATGSTSSRARVEAARGRVSQLQESLRRVEGEERRELRDEYELVAAAFQEEIRQALSDPDPAVRADMLGEVELDSSAGRDTVARLGDADPSPRVRVAAAELLGDDGTFQAVAELIGMLDDPEPEVLLATLEALDRSGDESIEPYIEPLSDHPDSRVRETANEMLEFWE